MANEGSQLKTPVAICVYNRPDLTEVLMRRLKQVRPQSVLIVADGARKNRPGEDRLCAEAVEAVVKGIDWSCDIKTNISKENMGCKERMSSGISWVFDQHEEAIILEDDCIPDLSFFPFVEELLTRYRDIDRVGMICGSNFIQDQHKIQHSYAFSRYSYVWGWASWRRTWKTFDKEMKSLAEDVENGLLEEVFPKNLRAREWWLSIFKATQMGLIDTWDYQLLLSHWVYGRVNAVPKVNMVSNIGFREDATHTKRKNRWAELPTYPTTFPMIHPVSRQPDLELDRKIEREVFSSSIPYRIFRKSKELVLKPRPLS